MLARKFEYTDFNTWIKSFTDNTEYRLMGVEYILSVY